MSGAQAEEVVRSAVPIPDLSIIDEALAATPDRLRKAVQSVRPADLGRDLSRRTIAQGRKLLEASDDRRAAAMLRAAHPAVAANALAARILDFMPTDHQVAILGVMSAEDRAQIEASLDPDDKAKVDRILSYGETAVARLMTPKVWRCERTATVGEALARLRAEQNVIEVAQNCYVVEGVKLVGVVPLRLLAVSDSAVLIDSIMTRDPIAVHDHRVDQPSAHRCDLRH